MLSKVAVVWGRLNPVLVAHPGSAYTAVIAF